MAELFFHLGVKIYNKLFRKAEKKCYFLGYQ